MEEPIMSREHLICRAISYSKETGEPLNESCRLNNIPLHSLYIWLKKYGVPWKMKERKQISKDKIEYFKKNQHKTVSEICKEKDWVYKSTVEMLSKHFHHHPNALTIKLNRDRNIIKSLIREGKTNYQISLQLHHNPRIIATIRREMNK